MNLYEEQSLDEEKEKSKKIIKIIIIALVILFILSICILEYISYLKNKQLKVYIDEKNVSIQNDNFIYENDTLYVSLQDVATQLGYTIKNGEYKNPYSEDKTKCYLSNNYEAASFILDSDKIYKTIITGVKGEDTDHEYFTIDNPVILRNNKLYASLDGLGKGCNLSSSYDKKNNTVKIYTLDYLSNFFANKIPDAKALAEQDDLNTYKNNKAVLYDMIVVKSENGKYGVNNLSNGSIIGEKYKSITFIEGQDFQEFIVETDEGKFGIIDSNGNTKIKPEYSSIKQIEKEKGLYLVSKNSSNTGSYNRQQYGIINKNAKIVIYLEYDQIGIDKTAFTSDNIDNQYILYGKCIPVKKSDKWGLLNLNGGTIIPIEYDDLGCKSNTSKNSQANSLLLIPEYDAIVVKKDNFYGLFNASGKRLIPELVTDMYVIDSLGEKNYYLTYNGNTMVIIDYLKDTLGIEPVNTYEDTQNTNKDDDKNISSNTTNQQTANEASSSENQNTDENSQNEAI